MCNQQKRDHRATKNNQQQPPYPLPLHPALYQGNYPSFDKWEPAIENYSAHDLLTLYGVPWEEACGNETLTLAERIKLMREETLALLDGLEMYRGAALAFEKDLHKCLVEREILEAEMGSLKFKLRGMEGERKMDDSELEQYRAAIKAFRRATARYF